MNDGQVEHMKVGWMFPGQNKTLDNLPFLVTTKVDISHFRESSETHKLVLLCALRRLYIYMYVYINANMQGICLPDIYVSAVVSSY